MSRYPRWWNRTITIYNRYEDPVTNVVTWIRHTVSGCFVKKANNRVTIGQTVLESNSVIVRIPEGNSYMTYGSWIQMTNDKRPSRYTLHQGDIVIFDNVNDIINEYSSGHRSTDVISKYKALDKCMIIANIAENIGGGRVDPHYYISGE